MTVVVPNELNITFASGKAHNTSTFVPTCNYAYALWRRLPLDAAPLHTRGVCGLMSNATADDDLLPSANNTANACKFALSWSSASCSGYTGKLPPPRTPPHPCATPAALSNATAACWSLVDAFGVFRSCHGAVDGAAFRDACAFVTREAPEQGLILDSCRVYPNDPDPEAYLH